MEISGNIENIIFRNDENGYTVAEIDVHGMLVTAVGIFPPLTEGEHVTLRGERKINPKYGEQFSVTEVIVTPPNDEESIEKYLGSGLFRGVGEILAHRIVEKFGKDTFEILEYSPSRLAEVKGISPAKALEIASAYHDMRRMQRAVMFLSQYDISLNLSIKIFKVFGELTESVVQNNPYSLVDAVDGIGFKTADGIAQSLGIEKDNPNRIRACIKYALEEYAQVNGHTWVNFNTLVFQVLELLGFEKEKGEDVCELIRDMEVGGYVKIIDKEEKEGVMLYKYYRKEREIARRLVEIKNANVPPILTLTREIRAFEKENNITLHDSQKVAIITAVNTGAVVITGGPGTGKTTIIKCIIYIFSRMKISYLLTAPTGRASKRMSQATGSPAKTIHRLLEFNFHSDPPSFNFNEENQLDADAIIADEISMADENIFLALLRAIKTGARLIIVGDSDQLPSVGAGNVLGDIIQSGALPVLRLTRIYRQEEGSYIITNAHLINKGQLPDVTNDSKDFFFLNQIEHTDIVKTVKECCSVRMPNYFKIKPSDIQVLTPMKKGVVGVSNLNNELQQLMNPPSRFKNEIVVGQSIIREGDRVIQMKNDYEIPWTRKEKNGSEFSGEGVFNGDVGIVTSIDKSVPEIYVKFEDDSIACYHQENFDELALSYAISVHKSQGSEFPIVILAIGQYNPLVVTKNLLYTAVTRAKTAVMLIGDRSTYHKVVRNKRTERRYTCLVEFINQVLEGDR